MSEKKEKIWIYAMDHALPTAFALSSKGKILCQHSGSNYEDAIAWLQHWHGDKLKEAIILDKEKVKECIYKKGDIDKLLGEDFRKALMKANGHEK